MVEFYQNRLCVQGGWLYGDGAKCLSLYRHKCGGAEEIRRKVENVA